MWRKRAACDAGRGSAAPGRKPSLNLTRGLTRRREGHGVAGSRRRPAKAYKTADSPARTGRGASRPGPKDECDESCRCSQCRRRGANRWRRSTVLGMFLQASLLVKIVMLALLGSSIWSWAIIVNKSIMYARFQRAMDKFETVFWSGTSLEELYATLSARPAQGMASLFVAAMREWKRSVQNVGSLVHGPAGPHRQGAGRVDRPRGRAARGQSPVPRDRRLGRPVRPACSARFGAS